MRKKIIGFSRDIRVRLENIYGENIIIRNGDSREHSFDIKGKQSSVDLVVYLCDKTCAAIVWNNLLRREMGSKTHCFNWSQSINSELISRGFIDEGHKQFRTDEGLVDETVLIMSFDTLINNQYDLYELLQIKRIRDESSDIDYPSYFENKIRGRRTVSQWNRSQKFRNKVLEAYGNQCAVCRCKEAKLLEAAHIKAVADGGKDDVENGICLCANHHLMLDAKLIKIDYKKMKLSYVSDSVKNMPWYDAFIQNGGNIVRRNNNG